MNLIDDNMVSAVGAAFRAKGLDKIGIAVSGGGDSIALLHLLARWVRDVNVDINVVTVDHGLRKEAAGEALFVARVARDLGFTHDTMKWRDWDGSGNLQNRARRARYGLIAEWAKSRGIDHVALGHTADDVAETFVMRLAREAGVDGLAAMKSRRLLHGVTFVRPMLGLERAGLRDFLKRQGKSWIEDPTNEDTRFERVRVRQALDAFEDIGIGREALATVAKNLASARDALAWHTFLQAKDVVKIEAGDVVVDRRLFRTVHDEIGRRLFVHALKWVSSTDYGPRRGAMSRFLASIKAGKGITLHGCHVSVTENQIRVFREFNAVENHIVNSGEIWDRRWRLVGPVVEGATIRALGTEGIRQCPNWRDGKQEFKVLLGTPSLWRGPVLIAAPLAGLSRDWSAQLQESDDDFFSSLAGH